MKRGKIGFLSYISRSGSTLLSRLLNEYKHICVTLEGDFPPEMLGLKKYNYIKFTSESDEINFIDDLFKYSKINSWLIPKHEILEKLSSQGFAKNSIRLFLFLLNAYREKHKPGAELVIYKGTPVLPWELIDLNKYFPSSEKIFLLRDPRAVYNSAKDTTSPYSQRKLAMSPFQIAESWAMASKVFNNNQIMNLHCIKYENLIKESDIILSSLLHELRISEEKNVTNSYYDLIPEKEKTYHKLVNKNPEITRIDAWKKSLRYRDIYIIERYLSFYLSFNGYSEITMKSWKYNPLYYSMYIFYRVYKVSRRTLTLIVRIIRTPKIAARKIGLKEYGKN